MNSIKKQARFAGLLYLLACLPAPFALLYVPGKLIVPGDATATANHVRTSEILLRLWHRGGTNQRHRLHLRGFRPLPIIQRS
jgi:Domain of unknown function (DUF4386)